jgi:hypothetical protein
LTTRWEVEKAAWDSDLEPPARLLVLALARKSDNDTAIVPPEHTPSLTTLMAMTGLSRSAVAEWLNALEDAGWVKRVRPPRDSRVERTTYVLLPGSPSAQRRPRKPSSPQGGLPTEDSVSGFGSPQGGLVRQEDHSSSPPRGLGVVRQEDAGSPPGGLAPISTYQEPFQEQKTSPRTRGTRIPDDFSATAEMIAWARKHTPHVGARETEEFIDYWQAAPGQRGVKANWLATWRNWMRREQKRIEEQRGRPGGQHRPFRNPEDPSGYYGDL